MLALSTKNNIRSASNAELQAYDALPVAIMACDLDAWRITYANPKSLALLESIRASLPVEPERIVGASLDVLDAEGVLAKRGLKSLASLPFSVDLALGDERLGVQASALLRTGGRAQALLTWSVITEKLQKQQEMDKLLRMIDGMPIAVMLCDPVEFRITYMNPTSLELLRRIAPYIQIRPEDALGSSIDVFHKNPHHQRTMLSDPRNLPHRTRIKLGPETLSLHVTAIYAANGAYLGPMLSWSIVTDSIRLADGVAQVVERLAGSSAGMNASAENMSGLASDTESMAISVSEAAEGLSGAVSETARDLRLASDVAARTAAKVDATDQLVQSLSSAADQINAIVGVIQNIAAKTNLLALNATIEAARAGEAGRGFTVVANEVKALAVQTAQSTREIKSRIDSILTATGETVSAVSEIAQDVRQMNATTQTVAKALEHQSASVGGIMSSISSVADAARMTGEAATEVSRIAEDLDAQSGELREEITRFLAKN